MDRDVLCRCDCGTERSVGISNLRSGASQSCGCSVREKAVERCHLRALEEGPPRAWLADQPEDAPADIATFEDSIARLFAGRFRIAGECWEFAGYRENGYVRIQVNGHRVFVHRYVLGLRLGRPVSKFALHHCDNPPCFRPRHIYEGDQARNAADRMARGRGATGPTHGKSKLTPETVIELRADRYGGMSYGALGSKYGISAESARFAALGRTWRAVA